MQFSKYRERSSSFCKTPSTPFQSLKCTSKVWRASTKKLLYGWACSKPTLEGLSWNYLGRGSYGGNSPNAQQIKDIRLFEIQKRVCQLQHPWPYLRKWAVLMRTQMLLTTAVQAQPYFTATSDVSKPYVDVSKGHIMPGISKIDELMFPNRTPTGYDHHEKMHELEMWAEDSRNKITIFLKRYV